jgi:large subunit ribosomal protein L5
MAKKAKPAATESEPAPKPRLLERYETEIIPALKTKLGRTNPHALPRLQKVVINMGVGEAVTEKKYMEDAAAALAVISGQKPKICRSRIAVAGFKLREDLPIGCMVTLRGKRMYEFMDRLISLALPRVRDFRGVSAKAFDGHGNYSLGLSEHLVFPEINPDKFPRAQGMNVTFVFSGQSDDESREVLRAFGMPFKAEGEGKAAKN